MIERSYDDFSNRAGVIMTTLFRQCIRWTNSRQAHLAQNLLHDIAVHIRKTVITALKSVRQT